jgi:hypothetical protein
MPTFSPLLDGLTELFQRAIPKATPPLPKAKVGFLRPEASEDVGFPYDPRLAYHPAGPDAPRFRFRLRVPPPKPSPELYWGLTGLLREYSPALAGAVDGIGSVVKKIVNDPGLAALPGPMAIEVGPTRLFSQLKQGLAARVKQTGKVAEAMPLEFASAADPSTWNAFERLTADEAARLWQEHNGKMLIESADPSRFLQSLGLPNHVVDRIKDQALAVAAKANPPVEQFGGFTHNTARNLARDWYRSPEGKAQSVNLDARLFEDTVQREVATGMENAPKGAAQDALIPTPAAGVNALVDWIDPRMIGVDQKLTAALNHIPYSNRLILEGAMEGKTIPELRTLTHSKSRHYTPIEIRNILDSSKVMIDYELKTGRAYADDLEAMLSQIVNAPGERSAGKMKEVLRMKFLNNWAVRTIADKLHLSPTQVQRLNDQGIKHLRESGAAAKYRELFLK